MIRIDRSTVPAPRVLLPAALKEWQRESKAFFVKRSRRKRLQERFEFRGWKRC